MTEKSLAAINEIIKMKNSNASSQIYKSMYGGIIRDASMLSALAGTTSAYMSFINNNKTVAMAAELARRVDSLMNPSVQHMINKSFVNAASRLESHGRAMQKYFEGNDSIRKAAEILNNHNSKIGSFISDNKSILNFHHNSMYQKDLYRSVEALYNSSLMFENKKITIDYISDVLSEEEIELVSPVQSSDVSAYKDKMLEIGEIDNEATFRKFMESLPKNIRVYIAMFFFTFFLPNLIDVINGVVVNLITPVVQEYLDGSDKSEKGKVHDIKKLVTMDVDKSQVRFITKDLVYLREKPSKKSSVIDELTLGQVVTVKSKVKNWIEISYKYESGEIVNGWVFTSYTAKFK
ncbi:Bacterial SH3 domain [Serratia marcescens]|uniref:SH3 domain-containing protein n=1 Tax=Serratia marcescens TaxID=615 RepID=UPI002177D81D|nr:SH3 domain-containing protein [Serratia marcescens]CAI1608350.1 Bacterial SH3 domain [Serratia marcescens]